LKDEVDESKKAQNFFFKKFAESKICFNFATPIRTEAGMIEREEAQKKEAVVTAGVLKKNQKNFLKSFAE
jgi:hypothetical protein